MNQDNLSRMRLLQAMKAGYVQPQHVPAQEAPPGTSTAVYMALAPFLNQMAQQQGHTGINGLLRAGMIRNAAEGGQQPPHVEPDNIAGNPDNGGTMEPGNGGYVPPSIVRPGAGDTSGVYDPGTTMGTPPIWNPGGSGAASYPPGTIGNFSIGTGARSPFSWMNQ